MELFLTLVGGFCWTWVYIESIRIGIKQRTYAMPLFALGLNFAWEAIYSYLGWTRHETITAQDVINVCWLIADVFIVVTWWRFGLKDWPEHLGKHTFGAWGALVFCVSFLLQLAFIREFGAEDAVIYSAYLQNLVMSLLFIDLFLRRKGKVGQSLTIAVNKWLGTLAAVILFGYLQQRTFVTLVGALCSVFDLVYIGLLVKAASFAQKPQLTVRSPAQAA
jgi:hypothetical protein